MPDALEKEQVLELFKMMNLGDDSAREIIARHNILLVLNEVTNKFKNVDYDKKELVAIGAVGLVNAINTFDVTKGIAFSTYAVHCIDNSILSFLRTLKKPERIYSLDSVYAVDEHGNELYYSNTLKDDFSVEENYEKDEISNILRNIIDNLPEKEREIIKLNFGFYDRVYSQREIARKMGFSSTYASKLVAKIVKKITLALKKEELIVSEEKKVKKNTTESYKMGTSKALYDLLGDYSKESVIESISSLNDFEKGILRKRFGDNLDCREINRLNNTERQILYGIIFKLRRILSCDVLFTKECDEVTQDDKVKLFTLINGDIFCKLGETFSFNEIMIIVLKYGYIDGKVFSDEAISKFLQIDIQSIHNIIDDTLLKYKNRLDSDIIRRKR